MFKIRFKKRPINFWNHRVISSVYTDKEGNETRLYSIAEVHYKHGIPTSYGEKNMLQSSENVSDLIWTRKKIKTAFKNPVLDADNWPFPVDYKISYLNREIKIGDLVEYIDTGSKTVKGKRIQSKVPIYGLWDGEKVECWDEEKTVVRNKAWLKIVNYKKY